MLLPAQLRKGGSRQVSLRGAPPRPASCKRQPAYLTLRSLLQVGPIEGCNSVKNQRNTLPIFDEIGVPLTQHPRSY